MKDILQKIQMLKVGALNRDYPIYAQYLNSQDGLLQTCNGKEFVQVEYELPFDGLVNIFVLENVLSKVEDLEDMEMYQDDDKIHIKCEAFKTTLNMLSRYDNSGKSRFPVLSFKKFKSYIVLTEELIETIGKAFDYIGNNIYQYVYIDHKSIIASDMYKAFMSPVELECKSPIGINKTIYPLLVPGTKLGVDSEDNIIVYYDENNYAIFSGLIPISEYPAESLSEFVASNRSELKLCNMLPVMSAIYKITAVLHNERLKIINFNHDGTGVMSVSTVSEMNGRSDYKVSISDDIGEFSMNIDLNHINKITSDYNMYYTAVRGEVYFNNGTDEIAVIGLA